MHYLIPLLSFGFLLGIHSLLFAQVTPGSSTVAEDSLRAEILRLHTDLQETRANLRISHHRFRTGILTSAIGYSITIIGGVLGGSAEYSEWGQPLIFAGGVIGFTGAVLIFNSNTYIGRAGGLPPRRKRQNNGS